MDSIDREVLKSCEQWLNSGHRCELITVVRTWGSSPRPEGAMLAICDDGRVVGSVSGGCIEDDLIHQAHTEGLTRVRPGAEIAISHIHHHEDVNVVIRDAFEAALRNCRMRSACGAAMSRRTIRHYTGG